MANNKARQLILLFDGTNNVFSGGENDTNVVLTAELLARSDDSNRLVLYTPGLGNPADSFVIGDLRKRIGALAFGRGIFDVVEKQYSFLMDNYREGDEIYMFGFSRGAFAARVVFELVSSFGLLQPQHRSLIRSLSYIAFSKGTRRATHSGKSHIEKRLELHPDRSRSLEEQVRRLFSRKIQRPIQIKFLGLWDTVASVGLPPFSLRLIPSASASGKAAQHIRHAVSIDENRAQFQVRLFGEPNGNFTTSDGSSGTLVQSWFPGGHADVGGGYSRAHSTLSDRSFQWMMTQAQEAGLRFAGNSPGESAHLKQLLDEVTPRTGHAQRHSELVSNPAWACLGMQERKPLELKLTKLNTSNENPAEELPLYKPNQLAVNLSIFLATYPVYVVMSALLLPTAGYWGISCEGDCLGTLLEAPKNLAAWRVGSLVGNDPYYELRDNSVFLVPLELLFIGLNAMFLSTFVVGAFDRWAFARRHVSNSSRMLRILGWVMPAFVGASILGAVLTPVAEVAYAKAPFPGFVVHTIIGLAEVAKYAALAVGIALVCVSNLPRTWLARI